MIYAFKCKGDTLRSIFCTIKTRKDLINKNIIWMKRNFFFRYRHQKKGQFINRTNQISINIGKKIYMILIR